VRLRLTMLYGSLFLVAGASLLAITYGLVSQSQNGPSVITFGATVKQQKGKPDAVFIEHAGSGGPILSQSLKGLPGPLGAGPPPGISHALWQRFVRITRQFQAAAVRTARQQDKSFYQRAGQTAVKRVRSASLSALLTESGIALGIMALLSIALGWLVAGRVLAPLRTMNARVREMSADSLHERLALSGRDDELKELGDTFDGLLARLEGSFESQRAFVANASHELRTPLTVERALIEVALADPEASVESLRETLERVLVAGEQQERTIEALLTLARSQRGLQVREPVDLRAAAVEAAGGVDAGAVRLECEFGQAATVGDPALVERLISNLLRNAVQHNVAPGGWARAWTGIREGRPVLTVTNTGPVIAPEEATTLLEPFRRLNGGRARHDGGVGLGLSIVGAIATAHGADLNLNPRAGGGLNVVVGFPTG
jgi:signal transduction histidine kinase